MKFAVASILSLLLIASAQASTPIRVMTFNIRYDGGARKSSPLETAWNSTEGVNRRDMVTQVIKDENPDVLALQEALPHQVEDISKQFEQYAFYSVGRDDGVQAGEHCSVFYRKKRFNRIDAGTFWLCETANTPGAKYPGASCPRIASWVRLDDLENPDRKLLLVNTHWDNVSQPARQYAALAITNRLHHLLAKGLTAKGPAIVVGDMNARSDSDEITSLLSDTRVPLRDAYRLVHPEQQADEATFNRFNNRTIGQRIDYILHTQELTPKAARIVRTTIAGKNLSDHFPVVVDFE